MVMIVIKSTWLKARPVLLAVILAASLLGSIAPQHVRAAPNASGNVFYVDVYEDDPSASACTSAPGDCSLRGAINKANNTPGAVTIYLQNGGYNIYGDVNVTEDKNEAGDIDIIKDGGAVTIIGDSISTTTIDVHHTDRIFDVQDMGSPTKLTLKNLSLVNGYAGPMQDGGSIRTYGSLYLDTVSISQSLGRMGGAIYIYSTYDQKLSIDRSVISHCTATLDGGAVYAKGEVTTITRSTFDHNSATGAMGAYFGNQNAGRGGAIYNNSSLTVTASTFAFNDALIDGGGILNYAFLGQSTNAYINSSTFHANSTAISNVATASGTLSTSAVTTIANSILNESTDSSNCVNKHDDHGKAAIINAGNNLDSGAGCAFGNNGGSIFGLNPHLGEMGDYGGPTPTLALLSGSPAINKGNASTCAGLDQRNLATVGTCDIGAFEYGANPTIRVSVGPGKGYLPDGSLGTKLTVVLTNALGNALSGWGVSFDPTSGGISLSSSSARTDANGVAYIYASINGLASDATINVNSGSASAYFLASHLGYIAASGYGSGLPNTGFAPGVVTHLPPQPANMAYDASQDIVLEIPSINLKTSVLGIPKVGNQWDITWLSNQVGHLEGTAFPSWQGNSVLTGHSVLADGTAGPFANLKNLKWGDRIILHVYGVPSVYEVRAVKSVGPDDQSVIGHKDEPWVTLLTCQDFSPAFQTYLKRLAISAVLVK